MSIVRITDSYAIYKISKFVIMISGDIFQRHKHAPIQSAREIFNGEADYDCVVAILQVPTQPLQINARVVLANEIKYSLEYAINCNIFTIPDWTGHNTNAARTFNLINAKIYRVDDAVISSLNYIDTNKIRFVQCSDEYALNKIFAKCSNIAMADII
jgi:hypothetical protein